MLTLGVRQKLLTRFNPLTVVHIYKILEFEKQLSNTYYKFIFKNDGRSPSAKIFDDNFFSPGDDKIVIFWVICTYDVHMGFNGLFGPIGPYLNGPFRPIELHWIPYGQVWAYWTLGSYCFIVQLPKNS